MAATPLVSKASSAQVPSYRRHRPTGQAVVTLDGKDRYLGKYDSPGSRREYDRLIGEWLAAGRSLPRPESDLTITELIIRYWEFAVGYYQKNGQPTSSLTAIRISLRNLRLSYGDVLAVKFGPLSLEALQLKLAQQGLARKTVNEQIAIIKRMYRWAVSKELVPVTTYQALATVAGLRKGRSPARETPPVRPVSDAVVEATLPSQRQRRPDHT